MLPMIDRQQTECDSANKNERGLEPQVEGAVESIKDWSQSQDVNDQHISQSMAVPERESKANEELGSSAVQLIDCEQTEDVLSNFPFQRKQSMILYVAPAEPIRDKKGNTSRGTNTGPGAHLPCALQERRGSDDISFCIPSAPQMGRAFMQRLPSIGMDCTQPYTHQAGGARELKRFSKTIVAKPCSSREAWFYETVASSMNPFTPECHGLRKGRDGGSAATLILLEDLTLGFRCPCVLDVKMGVCTAAPDRSESKRLSCEAKDKITTTGSIGARICGLRVYQVKSHEYRMLDKHWGKNLTFQDFSEGMQIFFNNGVRIRRRIAHRMLELLKPIARMMESVKYRFYASSILFIYEGLEEHPSDAGVDEMEEPAHEDHIESDAQVVESIDPSKNVSQGQHTDADPNFDSAKNAESIQKENQGLYARIDENARIEARMIDFAHVFPLEGTIEHRDESYLCGLKNLMAVLEGIGDGQEPSKINIHNYTNDARLHRHCLCAKGQSEREALGVLDSRTFVNDIEENENRDCSTLLP
uniref:Kinase n=1 Tax=Guillardia theta TaxID=55529 RepID=A0A7S4NTG6_GUITH|mmetsp:Transcript_33010/g.104371  ORF Transcript_33010/g.104371 Transcript_33010/m.104371 type:complete len:531 (+) Transcript_33010:100-1692(+)